jgi:carbohydrate-binding DOMON domain-containing protein
LLSFFLEAEMSALAVLQRVTSDTSYAQEMAAKANAAASIVPTAANVLGPEWSALIDAVAETPEERAQIVEALAKRPPNAPEHLARMVSAVNNRPQAEIETTTTTTTTLTTTSCLTLLTDIGCTAILTITLAPTM